MPERPRPTVSDEPDLEVDLTGAPAFTPRASIVIPVYNEGESVVPCVERILDVVEMPIEIVIVYDDLGDTTVPVVERMARQDRRVRGVLNNVGRGPAGAIRTGIHASQAEAVIITMADGSDDPESIEHMVRLIERGCAVVAASRYMPGGAQVGGPWFKQLLSRGAGLSLYWIARVGTRDATNSFKAYRRSWIEQVGIESEDGFEIGIELVAKARRTRSYVAEVPTIWLDRDAGESNFKLAKWLPRYLHWYRFAYGPRLRLDEVGPSSSPATSPKGTPS